MKNLIIIVKEEIKIEKNIYPEPIDNLTVYGKGLEPKNDPRTDVGKGLLYKTCDGKDVATME